MTVNDYILIVLHERIFMHSRISGMFANDRAVL